MTETGINSKMWSEEYEKKVIRILQGCESVTKNREYYHIKSSFKLEKFAGITKICRKKDNKIMTTKTNAWQIIRDLHNACGHKGEKKTYKKVAEHYANIPMVIIKQFIEQCERCTEKTKKVYSTGIVVRPIINKDLNSRAQIDLIDYQSLPDGQYKFILHYKEHLTKYSILRPLICKCAVEVAKELLNIYLDFGAPTVLQSDNGKEFTANIIKELGTLWPTLVLVNGRPRHPQSQGSVERANATVENALVAWMRDNKTSSWSLGLKFVQWGINTTYHDAIKMEPNKAMFGQPTKLGLGSKIPQEFLAAISNGITEENMDEILKIPDNESCKENDNGHEIMKDTMPENFEKYNIEEDIYNQEVTTDTLLCRLLVLVKYLKRIQKNLHQKHR
ncbi:KRAB-A domain-containing protein 2-like [Sitophilus oryzae]|uniref:KRAB-A domain-containing protein 2-like n=1 Tax=Sitophilus oryzae TaxID=7048 RepID=A0A6J2YNC8_SITOR|nr:KRAB-A domain-containing protein 2-like [Sitophilus oryzae]